MASLQGWGPVITGLLQEQPMSQRQFAKRAGVSRTALRSLASGSSEITVSTLERVLQSFGYELDAIKVAEVGGE